MQAALRQGIMIRQQERGSIGGVVGVVGKSTCKVGTLRIRVVSPAPGGGVGWVFAAVIAPLRVRRARSSAPALQVVARHPGSALLLKIRVLAD